MHSPAEQCRRGVRRRSVTYPRALRLLSPPTPFARARSTTAPSRPRLAHLGKGPLVARAHGPGAAAAEGGVPARVRHDNPYGVAEAHNDLARVYRDMGRLPKPKDTTGWRWRDARAGDTSSAGGGANRPRARRCTRTATRRPPRARGGVRVAGSTGHLLASGAGVGRAGGVRPRSRTRTWPAGTSNAPSPYSPRWTSRPGTRWPGSSTSLRERPLAAAS